MIAAKLIPYYCLVFVYSSYNGIGQLFLSIQENHFNKKLSSFSVGFFFWPLENWFRWDAFNLGHFFFFLIPLGCLPGLKSWGWFLQSFKGRLEVWCNGRSIKQSCCLKGKVQAGVPQNSRKLVIVVLSGFSTVSSCASDSRTHYCLQQLSQCVTTSQIWTLTYLQRIISLCLCPVLIKHS